MKTFTASHLSHKPAEVLAEALLSPVVIQRKNTNGDVMAEYVLTKRECVTDSDGAYESDSKGDVIDTVA